MVKEPRKRRAFDQEVADEILVRISSGESLNAICRDKGNIQIDKPDVFYWIRTNPEFANLYARARDEQADVLADEILSISDEKPVLEIVDGEIVDNSQFHQRQRLRVDARKWVAAKLKPKKYGERVTQELIGDEANPIRVVERRIVDPVKV